MKNGLRANRTGEEGILIVDDELSVQQSLTRLLTAAGYSNVLSAGNGVEASSTLIAQGADIHLVLLDLRMPKMDGIELMKHLVNVHPHVVGVIVITGHNSLLAAEEFFHLGTQTVLAIDYHTKPIDAEKLLGDIEKALAYVAAKRVAVLAAATQGVHERIDCVEIRLSEIASALKGMRRSLVSDLGMDLLRALIIALAVIALLTLGVGDFIAKVIRAIK